MLSGDPDRRFARGFGDVRPWRICAAPSAAGNRQRAWSTAGHVMRCNLLKVVVDGKTLAVWR
jgi:hypothetical protein